MRKRVLCALMISLCLLPACGRTETTGKRDAEELALQIRTGLIGMTACSATVDITADYGTRIYEFTVDASYDKDSGGVLTITKPEIIAGVTARIRNGETVLEYATASIETGALTTDGLSPMDALPLLLETARTGYLAEISLAPRGEGTALHLLSRDPEAVAGKGLEIGMVFDSETCAPLAAEIFMDGYRVILCSFTAFSITP